MFSLRRFANGEACLRREMKQKYCSRGEAVIVVWPVYQHSQCASNLVPLLRVVTEHTDVIYSILDSVLQFPDDHYFCRHSE